MNAAGAASQAALRNRRSAIELGLSPIAPAKRAAAIKQMLPKPKASGAIEATLPTQTILPKRSISMAARGSDLSRIVESGEISSKKASTSGYLGNQRFLQEAGVTETNGFTGYNTIRDALESGPLQGNSNYGYLRVSDDITTASQYRSFRVNMSEHGSLYSSESRCKDGDL
jgi:hypothetical protein